MADHETFRLRRARPGDRDACYRVCLLTGDAGRDASALFPDDPDALGNLFVGPYLALEPELAFVLEDDEGVCGYVLGALDTPTFYRRMEEEWLPPLRARHPRPVGPREQWTEAQKIYHEFHEPDFHFPPAFAPYPSHLHIDLLPRAQGRGWGRRMMEHLMRELAARGSPGVHLGLSARNDRAWRFYRKLGFEELERITTDDGGVIYMGRRLPV
ncbi:MAG: GNAT family N-acetyltransferase [Verrucomicrobia bacterium]|nr:MAG: GNAT family N-acetyltransferase [Verrucomicrobiota bacterium]